MICFVVSCFSSVCDSLRFVSVFLFVCPVCVSVCVCVSFLCVFLFFCVFPYVYVSLFLFVYPSSVCVLGFCVSSFCECFLLL